MLRTIFKWLIIIALTALAILLIIGLVNRNKKTKNQPVNQIEQIKLEDENVEEEVVKEEPNTLVIPVSNTASTEGITIWIGLGILGLTSFYLYKNRQSIEKIQD